MWRRAEKVEIADSKSQTRPFYQWADSVSKGCSFLFSLEAMAPYFPSSFLFSHLMSSWEGFVCAWIMGMCAASTL